jgi:hypothetical protein
VKEAPESPLMPIARYSQNDPFFVDLPSVKSLFGRQSQSEIPTIRAEFVYSTFLSITAPKTSKTVMHKSPVPA